MNIIHDGFGKPYNSKPSVSSFLTCLDIPKHSFPKTGRLAFVGCSREISIRRQVMGNQEPVAFEGRADYCLVVYGMPCIEDQSRGAPASLPNYATDTPAWQQMAFHASSTSSLEA